MASNDAKVILVKTLMTARCVSARSITFSRRRASRSSCQAIAPVAITRGESDPSPTMHATGSLEVRATHAAIAPPHESPATPRLTLLRS